MILSEDRPQSLCFLKSRHVEAGSMTCPSKARDLRIVFIRITAQIEQERTSLYLLQKLEFRSLSSNVS
jgi:hypothetical protein